jgi:putative phosphoesterase
VRLAVLADVHANLPALEAVLRDVDSLSPAGIWVAGDLVGYNPWPNEVLQILRDRRMKAIRGNHDRAALSGDTSRFNELAAAAVRWTRIQLTPGSVTYLKDLEDRTRATMPEGSVAMYHGSPRDDDEYVYPSSADEAVVKKAGAAFVILGHTHLPMALSFRSGVLINPGSVGQPRDGDPRASYALLDVAGVAVDFHRVEYDVGETQRRMRELKLPDMLADRLAFGL